MPYLVLLIKICMIYINKKLKKYFTFEVQVIDDKSVRRRFRASNYQVIIKIFTFQSNTRVKTFYLHYTQ